MRLGRFSFGFLKRNCEEMIVPRKAIRERPRPRVRQITRSGVALQRRRKVISVAVNRKQNKLRQDTKCRAPEIKVFRHVDLFEDSHEPLLLARLLDLVTRRYSKHLRFLTVVYIVPAKQRDGRSLRDKYHVPASREPDETYRRADLA